MDHEERHVKARGVARGARVALNLTQPEAAQVYRDASALFDLGASVVSLEMPEDVRDYAGMRALTGFLPEGGMLRLERYIPSE